MSFRDSFSTPEEWRDNLRSIAKDCERRLEIGCVYKRAVHMERRVEGGKTVYKPRPIETVEEYNARKLNWNLHLMNFLDLVLKELEQVEQEIFEKQCRGRLN